MPDIGALHPIIVHFVIALLFAGGVGTRTDDPADVERLLAAGLYHQAMRDREAGDGLAAARLLDELARRRSGDPEIQLLRAESLIIDRGDPTAALELLRSLSIEEDARRLRFRRGLHTATAFEALGMPDSARAVLGLLAQDFPDSQTLTERLEALRDRGPSRGPESQTTDGQPSDRRRRTGGGHDPSAAAPPTQP